jgi:predicted SprT family Zn-dependent metalloprotease
MTERVQAARKITHDTLAEYDLYDRGWRFKLTRGKNTLGWCNYKDKTIGISSHLIENGTIEEIANTIIHEIAHARTPGENHGWKWRAVAREMGLKNPGPYTKISYELPHKYELRCGVHGTIEKRHRRSKPEKLARIYCRKCGSGSVGTLRLVEVN